MTASSAAVYAGAALIDTCAVIALLNPADQWHGEAAAFYTTRGPLLWTTLDVTAHETFTRARYDYGLQSALEHYDFLRSASVQLLRFSADDEASAHDLLSRYDDQTISFHDALCAALMLRLGIYKVFTFDKHFRILGFEVLPGVTA